MLPDCKGWHANLAGRHQKKWQQNNPIPTGISNPKAEMYTPGQVNKFHRESISSDGFVLKDVRCKELFRRC